MVVSRLVDEARGNRFARPKSSKLRPDLQISYSFLLKCRRTWCVHCEPDVILGFLIREMGCRLHRFNANSQAEFPESFAFRRWVLNGTGKMIGCVCYSSWPIVVVYKARYILIMNLSTDTLIKDFSMIYLVRFENQTSYGRFATPHYISAA